MVRKREQFEDDFEDDLMIRRNVDVDSGFSQPKARSRRGRRFADDDAPKKAPIIYRFIAWSALILLFFGIGYWGTSFAVKFLNKKKVITQADVVQNREEISQALTSEGVSGRKVSFPIYVPMSGEIVQKKIVVVSSLMEEDIQHVTQKIMEECGEPFRGGTVLHVFRNGDTAYLDMNSAFLSALNTLGQETSTLFITGIVRTVKENFSPVTKVRFLVEGKVPQSGASVNLSVPWELKS